MTVFISRKLYACPALLYAPSRPIHSDPRKEIGRGLFIVDSDFVGPIQDLVLDLFGIHNDLFTIILIIVIINQIQYSLRTIFQRHQWRPAALPRRRAVR